MAGYRPTSTVASPSFHGTAPNRPPNGFSGSRRADSARLIRSRLSKIKQSDFRECKSVKYLFAPAHSGLIVTTS
jgi:hypothetical protein